MLLGGSIRVGMLFGFHLDNSLSERGPIKTTFFANVDLPEVELLVL